MLSVPHAQTDATNVDIAKPLSQEASLYSFATSWVTGYPRLPNFSTARSQRPLVLLTCVSTVVYVGRLLAHYPASSDWYQNENEYSLTCCSPMCWKLRLQAIDLVEFKSTLRTVDQQHTHNVHKYVKSVLILDVFFILSSFCSATATCNWGKPFRSSSWQGHEIGYLT